MDRSSMGGYRNLNNSAFPAGREKPSRSHQKRISLRQKMSSRGCSMKEVKRGAVILSFGLFCIYLQIRIFFSLAPLLTDEF